MNKKRKENIMSNVIKRFLMATVMILLIVNSVASAQSNLKSTGIGLRGSFYNPSKNTSSVKVSWGPGYSVNNTVSAGGCLYVFSRLSESVLFEFSIGNIASVEQEVSFIASQKVGVFNMTPILFGLRYDFLQSQNYGLLQPYLSGGFGAYVFSDVKVAQGILYEDVEVVSNVKPGLYLASGLNIYLSSWIALNFDGKYHFVNLNPDFERSGFEFGIGFNFVWGSFEN
jgi:outer membrane protein W